MSTTASPRRRNQSRRALIGLALACCVFSSCTTVAPDWRHAESGEAHELAQAVCDEVLAVEADPARARKWAAKLDDRRIVHTEVDPDGTSIEVTVRDVAFTILEASGVIEDRVDRKLDLLHGCQAGAEWIRIRIPALNDEDFEAARRRLSRPSRDGLPQT